MAKPPYAVTPLLFLAKIDEEIIFDERTYYLGTNEYQDGSLSPAGFVHLESFCIEDNSPVFTYRLGGRDGITLEKRIWMAQGYNTTYIQYRVLRTNMPTTEHRRRRAPTLPGSNLKNAYTQAVLNIQYHQHIMDVVTQYLLTPYGLRTLATHDPTYRGHLGTSYTEQQQALHQGSTYTWLIGPYIDSMLAMSTQSQSRERDYALCQEYLWRKGLRLLEPLRERFITGLLEGCEGLADGDAPYTAGPSAGSALSNAELLRSYERLTRLCSTQRAQMTLP